MRISQMNKNIAKTNALLVVVAKEEGKRGGM